MPAHSEHSTPASRSSPPGRSSRSGWDHLADWYDKLVGDAGSDYHQNVIIPAALRLLEPRRGERLVDLCCGQGVFVRALLDAGAGFVMGLDASPRLIAAARQRTPAGPRVRFRVADVTQGGDWLDASYDGAACIMAAQDLADLEGLAMALAGVLRVGGRAVIILMHPCFRVPRQSGWGWDYEKKSQFRRIDRYASPMQIPIATRPGASPGMTNLFHHRPLADYINALSNAGLLIDRCEEPRSHRRSDSGGRSRGENRATEEFPLFLALRAVKLEPRRVQPSLPTLPTTT